MTRRAHHGRWTESHACEVTPILRRKHSNWHYIRKILPAIWAHPANRHDRLGAVRRSLTWQVYKRITGRSRVIDVYDGMKLRCYPDSASASNVIYFTGLFDYSEMLFMSRYLRAGDGYVDCGANIGVYTLLAASLVGPRGRLDAIEPFPISVARLRENVELNRLAHVHIHAAAATDRAGVAHFTTAYDVSNRIGALADAGKPMIEVPTARLDELVDPECKYAMAKLDVEGSEVLALRGATCMLERQNPPVWQFEAIDFLLEEQGADRSTLLREFAECGFEILSFDEETGNLKSVDTSDRAIRNFLAVASAHRNAVEERLRDGFSGE